MDIQIGALPRAIAAAMTFLCLASPGQSAEPSRVVAGYRSEMRTERNGVPVTASIDWRFERGESYAAVSDAASHRAERWQRDETGRLWYWRIYGAERKVIEYAPADLGIGGIANSWQRVVTVIDPKVLEQLNRLSGHKEVLGRDAEVYSGIVNGVTTEVWWLPAEQLPAYVARRSLGSSSSLTLQSLQLLDESNERWARSVALLEGYETLDFSDIGDREGDPFIERIMRLEGTWFGH
jgi:hypothetical protein